MDRATAVDELKRVYRVLLDDLEEALTLGRENPTPFAHRTLFRTYFALVEGVGYQLRQVTLATLQHTHFLTDGELAVLREQRFRLNSKGEPKECENFQAVVPNLLFSIRCYVKNHGATYSPDTGVKGWHSLQEAIKIRDRLTHPKSASGLEVTDEDLQTFAEGAAWWKKTLTDMFAVCERADKHYRNLPDPLPTSI